jgi:hypothetical protein
VRAESGEQMTEDGLLRAEDGRQRIEGGGLIDLEGMLG